MLEIQRPALNDGGEAKDPPEYNKMNPTTIVGELKRSTFVRNQIGAHYNIAGTVISDGDVAQFADLTVQLAEALSCPTCGQIPSKNTGTHFQCSCNLPCEVRMLPLQL